MSRGVPSDSKLGRSEWIALVVALVVAHGFYWRIVHFPSGYDALSYREIAIDISEGGLFRKFLGSYGRTFGYPLILGGLYRLANAVGLPWLWLTFETQLAAHIAAALSVRAAMSRHSLELRRLVFVGLVVNPISLSYTPETLTESASLTTMMLVASCWLRAVAADKTAPIIGAILTGSLLAGFAIMLRPANIFVAAAWTVAVIAMAIMRRFPRRRVVLAFLALAIGVSLPTLPQVRNNSVYYGTATPLIAMPLDRLQQGLGILYIKYATAMPPISTPSIYYENPLVAETEVDKDHPLQWYGEHPVSGAITLALHVFNMLDQDLLFTYSRDLDPWYRLPVGFVTHSVIGLALLAMALLVMRARVGTDSAIRLGILALGAFIVAHIAIHMTTAVEMRFGVPLLAVALPLAMWMLLAKIRFASRRRQWMVAFSVAIYAVGALSLSAWVREQAPAIRALQAVQVSNASPGATAPLSFAG